MEEYLSRIFRPRANPRDEHSIPRRYYAGQCLRKPLKGGPGPFAV